MSKTSFSLLHCLRTMSGAYRQDTRSDAHLIERFLATHDETAIATLAVRHGPMVWEICRRILGNEADAEDAYQVTFLALAKKAGKIQVADTVAGWLCQVARQCALNGRKAKKSRQKYEKEMRQTDHESSSLDNQAIEADESYALLYEELAKLSEKQRVVLVLHYLEGKTQDEVAEILCVGKTAIWDRLNRGKALLLKRLTQRGLTLGATGLVAMLEENASHAAIPPALLARTVQAATALSDKKLTGGVAKLAAEVLKHVPTVAPWWKAGWMIGLLCVGGLGLAAGGVAWKARFLSPEAKDPPTVHVTKKAESPEPLIGAESDRVRLDLFGDPLPPGALARVGTVRFRTSDGAPFSDVAFGPDGKTVLTTSDGSAVIRVWEIATGKELRKIYGPVGPNGVFNDLRLIVSPTRKQLVVARSGGDLWCWDLSGNAERLQWKTNPGHGSLLAFAPDGKTLAWSGVEVRNGREDFRDHISLRDAKTGKEIRKIMCDGKGRFRQLIISPDGRRLAALGDQIRGDRFVWLFDVANGAESRRFECHSSIASVTFSPNGETLAAATADQVQTWKVADGELQHHWPSTKSRHPIIAYLPDGKTLAITAGSECVRFLDSVTGKDVRAAVKCFGYFDTWEMDERRDVLSPDGQWFASANGPSLGIWNLVTGKQAGPTEAPNNHIIGVTFSSSDEALATYTMPGVVQIWEARTGRPEQRINKDPLSRWLSHARSISFGGEQRLCTVEANSKGAAGELAVWNLSKNASPKLARKLPIESGCAVTPDGRLVAVSHGNDVCLYLLETGRELLRIKNVHKGARHLLSRMLDFSEDGRTLLSWSTVPRFQGQVEVEQEQFLAAWDVSTGQPRLGPLGFLKLPPIRRGTLRPTLAVSPDGRWVAAALTAYKQPGVNQNEEIQLLEVASALPGPVIEKQARSINCLAFSPDGVAIAGGRASIGARHRMVPIHVWDIASGSELASFRGHWSTVNEVAFAPSGRRLASCSDDSTAFVWDLERLQVPKNASKRSPKTAVLCKELAGMDASKAYQAIRQLTEMPAQALPLLRELLTPAATPTPTQIEQWITDLGSDRFAIRKQALAELKKCGRGVEERLRQELKKNPSADIKRSLEEVIEHPDNSHEIQIVRGIEALERIGTPDARRLLKEYTTSKDLVLATEARAALQRRLPKRESGTERR